MRTSAMAVLAYAAVAVQPALNQGFAGAPGAVWLPGLAAVLGLFAFPPALALLGTAMAGFLSDCLQSPPLGIETVCLTIVTFLVRQVVGARPVLTLPLAGVAAMVVTFAALVAAHATRTIVAGVAIDSAALMALATRHAIGNAIVVMTATWFVRALPFRSVEC